jgi:hypothetical protein
LDDYRTPFLALVRREHWPPEFAIQPIEAVLCAVNSHVCCPKPTKLADGADDCRALLHLSSKAARNQLDSLWGKCRGVSARCRFLWAIQKTNTPPQPDACKKGKLRKPQTLCVPAVRVSDYVSMQRIHMPASVDVPAAAKAVLGCHLRIRISSDELARCTAQVNEPLLNALNGGDYRYTLRTSGEVAVPVRAYSVTLGARTEDAVERVNDSAKKVLRIGPVQFSSQPGMFIFDRETLRHGFRAQSESAATSAVPVGVPQAASEIPDREPMSLSAIRRMSWDPPLAGWIKEDALPSIVLIETHSFAAKHTELASVRIIDSAQLEAASKRPSAPCPANRQSDYELDDDLASAPETIAHGAYVTSIVAASANHRATVGVLPASNITPEILKKRGIVTLLRVSNFNTFTGPFINLINLCNSQNNPFVIANISGTSTNDAAREALRRALSGGESGSPVDSFVLGVAAAGDPEHFPDLGNRELQPGCRVYPGCSTRTTNHLISVVSMSEDGSSTSSASLLGTAFDVAAIGETEVTGPADKSAPHSERGTSFAAPYVTSLAALVYAKYRSHRNGKPGPLAPHAIKSRILATVDFKPLLEGKVAFGMVNYRRALELESNRGVYHADPCRDDTAALDEDKSERLRVSMNGDLEIHGGENDAGQPLDAPTVSLRQILRLSRICKPGMGPTPRFNLVLARPKRGSTTQFGYLELYRNVTIAESLLPLYGKGDAQIPTAQLRDFTACLRADPLSDEHKCLDP